MINLLPTDYARTIRYARQNTMLRKWLLGSGLATAGLIVILFGGWVYIKEQSHSLQKHIDTTDHQLKAEDLTGVQKQAKEISGDIKVINQVLGSEIKFSDLIQAIGNDMPPGTVLDSLSLSKLSGGIDLSASSKDYPSAALIPVNLSSAQNQLFSKVDIVNINCDSSVTKAYACDINLRALFSKDTQNRFLSVPKETK